MKKKNEYDLTSLGKVPIIIGGILFAMFIYFIIYAVFLF
jgi:hypothetical protein